MAFLSFCVCLIVFLQLPCVIGTAQQRRKLMMSQHRGLMTSQRTGFG